MSILILQYSPSSQLPAPTYSPVNSSSAPNPSNHGLGYNFPKKRGTPLSPNTQMLTHQETQEIEAVTKEKPSFLLLLGIHLQKTRNISPEIFDLITRKLPLFFTFDVLGASKNQLLRIGKHVKFNQIGEMKGFEIDGSTVKYFGTSFCNHLVSPVFFDCLIQCFKSEFIDYISKHRRVNYMAQFNRLDLLEILYNNTDQFKSLVVVIDIAAQHGFFDIVKFLIDVGADFNSNTALIAGKNEHLEIQEYINEHLELADD